VTGGEGYGVEKRRGVIVESILGRVKNRRDVSFGEKGLRETYPPIVRCQSDLGGVELVR